MNDTGLLEIAGLLDDDIQPPKLKPCGSRSGVLCLEGLSGSSNACEICGWNCEEERRRKSIPLTIDPETRLSRKAVRRKLHR